MESGDLTVEMETGTGKTYVYLRTIFELNKRYGFTKFVVVVPSIAIKEGVYKSLQITDDHFRALYSGTTFEYFLYDSTKPAHRTAARSLPAARRAAAIAFPVTARWNPVFYRTINRLARICSGSSV